MIASWPVYRAERCFEKEETDIGRIKEAVRGIRNVRAQMNVGACRVQNISSVTKGIYG